MPYKNTIMPFLDKLDDLATTIGACNNIYRSGGQLVGTNTDWLGVKGCLLEKGDEGQRPGPERQSPSLIVGAGGASRAAVYALSAHLHSSTIYIINRDDKEVEDLSRDVQKLSPTPTIIHVKTLSQARKLGIPYYIVGTVPDLEPKSDSERAMSAILVHFLEQRPVGVLLDMCFKPRYNVDPISDWDETTVPDEVEAATESTSARRFAGTSYLSSRTISTQRKTPAMTTYDRKTLPDITHGAVLLGAFFFLTLTFRTKKTFQVVAYDPYIVVGNSAASILAYYEQNDLPYYEYFDESATGVWDYIVTSAFGVGFIS
jgi:hypothetical protein